MPLDFTEPRDLKAVIGSIAARTVIGSKMRTADWDRVPAEVRRRAFFSAGIESERFLQLAKQRISDLVQRVRVDTKGGEAWSADRTKIVAELRQLGEDLGLQPPDGPRQGSVKDTSLTDPLSIRRLKLIVDTQMEMAYGYGEYLSAHDPVVRKMWPFWELVRVSARRVPRDWPKRWAEAGGKIYGGRMIAPKGDDLWMRISRFGNPWPPYDFASGMGVRDVSAKDGKALGIELAGVEAKAEPAEFDANLEAHIGELDDQDKAALQKLFKDSGEEVEIDEGQARLREAPQAKSTQPADPLAAARARLQGMRQRNRTEAVREKMRNAAYRREDDLSYGVNDTRKVRDGVTVVFKSMEGEHDGHLRTGIEPGTQFKREISASIIDEALDVGLIPPTTELNWRGKIGSAQLFMRGWKEPYDALGARLSRSTTDGQGHLLMGFRGISTRLAQDWQLLDDLLMHVDRHGANWLVKVEKRSVKVRLIDNGLCLPDEAGVLEKRFAGPAEGANVDKLNLARLDRFISEEAQIRSRLQPLLEPSAINALFARAKALRDRGRYGRFEMDELNRHLPPGDKITRKLPYY